MHDRVSRAFVLAMSTVCGLLVVLGSSACSSSSPAGPGAATVVVRFVQAAPAIGAVDLYDSASSKSRTLVAGNLALGQSDTVTTGQGTHWYDVALHGQTGTISAAPQAGSALLLSTFSYDVVVLDSGATPAAFGQLLPAVLPDTVSGNTKLRVVNGAQALNPVDLYFLSSGTPFPGAGPQFSGLAFPLNTSTNGSPTYYGATSGPTEIVVMPTGDQTQADAYVDSTVTLIAGQAMTAVLVPNPSVAGKGLLVFLRDH
jgi:hypothetical protein